MAILISNELTIGLKSEQAGALIERSERHDGTTLGERVTPFADRQRLPPARPASLERASPNGSKNGDRVAHRRRAQKRVRRRFKAQLAKESVEHGRREAEDYVRPLAGPPFLVLWAEIRNRIPRRIEFLAR